MAPTHPGKTTLRNGRSIRIEPAPSSKATGVFKTYASMSQGDRKAHKKKLAEIEKLTGRNIFDLIPSANRPDDWSKKPAQVEPAIALAAHRLALATRNNFNQFQQTLSEAIKEATGDPKAKAKLEHFLTAAEKHARKAGADSATHKIKSKPAPPPVAPVTPPQPAKPKPVAPTAPPIHFLPIYHRRRPEETPEQFRHLLNAPPTLQEFTCRRDKFIEHEMEFYWQATRGMKQDVNVGGRLEWFFTRNAALEAIKQREEVLIRQGNARNYYSRYWDEIVCQ